MSYTPVQRERLLQIARDSIRHGCKAGKPLPVDVSALDDELREKRATFVTLEISGRLRGCIGVLSAIRPLAEDVADNAYAAAFRDPRFAPVTLSEIENLEIHISILSPSEPLVFSSEEDLLRQIRPGMDGLIFSDGARKGTFLPAVWDDLPNPRDFLRELKMKAGLPPDHWSNSVKVERYTCEGIP